MYHEPELIRAMSVERVMLRTTMRRRAPDTVDASRPSNTERPSAAEGMKHRVTLPAEAALPEFRPKAVAQETRRFWNASEGVVCQNQLGRRHCHSCAALLAKIGASCVASRASSVAIVQKAESAACFCVLSPMMNRVRLSCARALRCLQCCPRSSAAESGGDEAPRHAGCAGSHCTPSD